MKALLCRANADDIGTVKIGDVTLPELGANDVRIRVRAAAVNFPDILMIQGKYQHKPELPYVPGMDLTGRVLEVGDGIARVSGLPDAAVNELLEFEGGTVGLALNLDEESIGAVILGEGEKAAAIEEGSPVRATGSTGTR